MRNRIALGLAVAAGLIATSVVARYLKAADLLEAEAAKRIVQVAVGLALALWGNYMPKGFGAHAAPQCAYSATRSAIRVGGWAMTLAGLTHAAMWAFAPLSVADAIATTAVVAAIAVTMTYGLWALSRSRPRPGKNASA